MYFMREQIDNDYQSNFPQWESDNIMIESCKIYCKFNPMKSAASNSSESFSNTTEDGLINSTKSSVNSIRNPVNLSKNSSKSAENSIPRSSMSTEDLSLISVNNAEKPQCSNISEIVDSSTSIADDYLPLSRKKIKIALQKRKK